MVYKIYISGDFPSGWRKAIIIPISKPGKDPTNPTNYLHIALASCICKTMGRMINRRHIWYLESHNLHTISCIYLFLTPNSRSVFRAGVSLNIHSFIPIIYTLMCNVTSEHDVARSSILLRFETFCREAFIHNQHLISVVVVVVGGGGYLENAYDTTWNYGGPPWLRPKRSTSNFYF